MKRTLPILALLASLPAWAVGEHISVTGPAREQLSETLCISMECNGGTDYTVASKVVGAQMELKVLGPDGGVRLTLKMPAIGNRMASSDAMSATSQLVHAIETPFVAPPVKAAVEKPAKKTKVAKHHLNPPIRVASRMRARG